ncbi:MAG: M43 family zinc metalloprotease, partial [Nanoarchaeota archaeon]
HDCISNPGYKTTSIWTIGVQPYVITFGGIPAVDESRIASDIESLNEYFQPMGLPFIRLDDTQTIHIESGTWWDLNISGNSTELNDLFTNITYSTGHWPMIYVNTIGGGYAQGAARQCNYQGIILAAKDKYGKISSPGQVAAHEFGHQFCLYHTHENRCDLEECDGSNCYNAGDFVCDTPRDNSPTMITTVNACSYAGYHTSCEVNCTSCNPDTSNIMSYYDNCRDNFTKEQRKIMVCYLDSW